MSSSQDMRAEEVGFIETKVQRALQNIATILNWSLLLNFSVLKVQCFNGEQKCYIILNVNLKKYMSVSHSLCSLQPQTTKF